MPIVVWLLIGVIGAIICILMMRKIFQLQKEIEGRKGPMFSGADYFMPLIMVLLGPVMIIAIVALPLPDLLYLRNRKRCLNNGGKP